MKSRIAVLLGLLILAPAISYASDMSIVVVLSSDDSLAIGREFCEGDTISSTGGAALDLPDGSVVELEKNTQIRVDAMRPKASTPLTKLHIIRGGVRAQVVPRRNQDFQITTPVSVAGVRGTDFSVEFEQGGGDHGGDASDVDVYDGSVDVTQSSTGATEKIPNGSGISVEARRFARREVSEERRQKWEDRRQATIDRLKTRWNISSDDELATKIKEKLNNISPERRDAIRSRVRNSINESRNRIQNRQQRGGRGPGNGRGNIQQRRGNSAPNVPQGRPGRR